MSFNDDNAMPSCSMDINKTEKEKPCRIIKYKVSQRTNSVIQTENKYATDYHSDDESTISGEPPELIEQIYQDKIDDIKNLQYQLEIGTHPQYVKQLKELDDAKNDELMMIKMRKDLMSEMINNEFIKNVRNIYKEFQDYRADLSETLVAEFNEKKKPIKQEYVTDDISQDFFEKPTRKLRRRPNEPVIPETQEKRRKPVPVSSIQHVLHEDEIDQDVKEIQTALASMPNISSTSIRSVKNRDTVNSFSTNKSDLSTSSGYMTPKKCQDSKIKGSSNIPHPRIEGGKLLYEKRWFHRGQPVFIEGMQMTKIPAVISAIGNETIWVKNTVDNTKFRVNLSHLINGKMSIKRRAH